jgi:hypothetical protein
MIEKVLEQLKAESPESDAVVILSGVLQRSMSCDTHYAVA